MTITLEVLEPNKEIEKYRCKIIEKNDKYIIVDYPIHVERNRSSFIPIGTDVRVVFAHKTAIYQFSSEIASKIKSKIPALAIPIPEKNSFKRIQRRKFVRIDVPVDVAIHSVNHTFHPFTSVTVDISGGGLSTIIHNDAISKGDIVRVYLSLPMKSGKYSYIIVEAEVVFIKVQNNIRSASMKFINIDSQDQQNIIRYCFEQERELRSKELI